MVFFGSKNNKFSRNILKNVIIFKVIGWNRLK